MVLHSFEDEEAGGQSAEKVGKSSSEEMPAKATTTRTTIESI